MAEETIKPKPKRVVTRIGDIFCVEFGNGFKGYFQYVAKDIEQLNSSVIRVFDTHYKYDYEPTLSEIVCDKVAFYAHTVLRSGIELSNWCKIGNSNEIDLANLERIYFGTAHEIIFNLPDGSFVNEGVKVNPLENWRIWHINQQVEMIGKLPVEYLDLVEPGSVKPYKEIRTRMQLGYYKYTSPIYDVVKRHPRPDVDSYLRRENEGKVTYYHFHGEYVVEQMDIDGESVVRLTDVQPVCEGHFLYDQPFGSINWHYDDFITAEEFNRVWISPEEEQNKLFGNDA